MSEKTCASCDAKCAEHYCSACKRVIQEFADEQGIDFHRAAGKLNADRRTYSGADRGGPTSTRHAPADFNYHGERKYDV